MMSIWILRMLRMLHASSFFLYFFFSLFMFVFRVRFDNKYTLSHPLHCFTGREGVYLPFRDRRSSRHLFSCQDRHGSGRENIIWMSYLFEKCEETNHKKLMTTITQPKRHWGRCHRRRRQLHGRILQTHYPRRARSALGVDIVLTLDVCLYVCMFVCLYVC